MLETWEYSKELYNDETMKRKTKNHVVQLDAAGSSGQMVMMICP